MTVTEPGVYDGMPDAEYHADPVPGGSLSSTGARRLLPPSCPARYKYEQDHPPESTTTFDIGTAAHSLILGAGRPIVAVDADDWRAKAARDEREAIRDTGAVPLLRAEYAQVRAMAAAIREHPLATALLDPAGGKPEQSLFWVDVTGTWLRARIDWLPGTDSRRRMIAVDYKTTSSASPGAFAKSVASFGYHQQAAQYADGIRALGLDADPAFLFIAQEKTPPYLVTVFELDAAAMQAGRALNRRAIEIYRDCTESGIWPGYSQDIELISLPPWAARIEEYA